MRISLRLAGAMLCFAATAVGQADEGLVVHYAFDEGAGEVVRDRSGHGHDGRIVGNAQWVQEKDRKVLRFDGVTTYVDAGTKANAMMGQRGTLEVWCLPEDIRGGLISWHTSNVPPGPFQSPDQRLVMALATFKGDLLIGTTSDGVDSTWSPRTPVEKGKWFHLAMTYDGTKLQHFVNGDLCASVFQRASPNLKGVPLRIGMSYGLGPTHFVGRMAEVRVYNRALSVEEVGRRFIAGVRELGIDILPSVRVTPRFDAKRGELTALCDLARIPVLPRRPGLFVVLRDENKNVLQEKAAPIPPNTRVVLVVLLTASLFAGWYEVSASVKDLSADQVVVEPTTIRWYLPEVAQIAGAPEGRKILSNLVTQLAAVDNVAVRDYQEVPFVNPRKGWVFVSTTAPSGGSGIVTIAVDGDKQDPAIVHRAGDKPTMETMRLLSAGEHKLRIWAQPETGGKQPPIARLVLRAVPALMYCGWPATSYAGYGEYDFAFLARDVLPNINTLIGRAEPPCDTDRAEWKRRGGQCLLEQTIPGHPVTRQLRKDVPTPLTADYAYDYWTQSPGFANPYFDGVMVDEVDTGDDSPDFRGYIGAVKRIAANPDFNDKAVHVWGGAEATYVPSLASEFVRVLPGCTYKFAPNTYLSEGPTVEEAKAMIGIEIRRVMERSAEVIPGFPCHTIMNLSFFSAPPFTSNLNPHVDFKVFLDMQFEHIATSPECFGLWGVLVYKAHYAEEEAVRWAGRLFRHYCIEGNTYLLSTHYGFTYNLRHIRNADFNEGLTGWQVTPAEPGTVEAGKMTGLHQLLGRYRGANEGGTFLLMKRSGKKPNRVSQDIVGLRAGRFYSMKMVVADHQDLVQAKSEKKRLTVSVSIANVEMIPAKSFVADVQSQTPVAQYAGKTPPYINHHRLVFRAKDPTAHLAISDWANATTPGGPVGQETLVNFIEIQPYLED